MGLFGLDANSSTSALTQAQVSTQYGNAYGANVGKGSASSNASGTVTIAGGVNVKKGGNVTIDNTNTQLENSLLEGLTNIQSALAGGNSSGGDSGSSSSGLLGLGGSSKSGQGGKSGTGGAVEGGNISLGGSGGSGSSDLGALEDNQSLNTNPVNDLVTALQSLGTSDISTVSHPPVGSVVFAPSSGGNSTDQGTSGFPWLTVALVAGGLGALYLTVKLFKP